MSHGIKESPRRRSKKIRIGDEEITRESLPSMQAWMLNPSHTEQGIQDVLDATLGNRIIQNPQIGTDQAGLQATSEVRNDIWENNK